MRVLGDRPRDVAEPLPNAPLGDPVGLERKLALPGRPALDKQRPPELDPFTGLGYIEQLPEKDVDWQRKADIYEVVQSDDPRAIWASQVAPLSTSNAHPSLTRSPGSRRESTVP
jgi:hypothetical protein